MRTNSFYVGLVACFLAGGIARADQIYTYTLTLPSISGGAEVDSNLTQYAFSWIGPLKFNSADNTSCPTVCGPVSGGSVKDGYSFAGFDFTSVGSDPEVQVNFADNSNSANTIVFNFVEPDSFWAAQGSDISFTSGTGANFSIGGTDPPCTACTVSITATAATPEPRSSILLIGLMGAIVLVIERRRRQSSMIG